MMDTNVVRRRAAIVSIAITVLILSSCRDANPLNIHPCENAERVVARFTVYEHVGKSVAATDTILGGSTATFSADQRYDSYEWHIGTDNRTWSDSTFNMQFRFPEVNPGSSIPITFIGKRAPNSVCFPDDPGIDTVRRELVVLSMYSSPLLGSYKGYHIDDPADTFTVDIFWKTEDFLVMRNINRGCLDTSRKLSSLVEKEMGATVMEFDALGGYDDSGCRNPKGIVHLTNGNQIEIDYVYDKARISKKFVGWRVR